MKVTYLGHACVSIEIEGKHFLVDPFISANPLASYISIDAVKTKLAGVATSSLFDLAVLY